jgi:hypothetical protein
MIKIHGKRVDVYLINHVNSVLRTRYNLDAKQSLYHPAELRLAIESLL